MNQRFISVLVFAFVVAGCASLLLYRLTVNHASTQAAPSTTKALVASRNLELGAIIKDPDVKDIPWPGVTEYAQCRDESDEGNIIGLLRRHHHDL